MAGNCIFINEFFENLFWFCPLPSVPFLGCLHEPIFGDRLSYAKSLLRTINIPGSLVNGSRNQVLMDSQLEVIFIRCFTRYFNAILQSFSSKFFDCSQANFVTITFILSFCPLCNFRGTNWSSDLQHIIRSKVMNWEIQRVLSPLEF